MKLKTLAAKLRKISARVKRLEKRRRLRPRLNFSGRLSESRERLLNATKLAAAMDVSASFILAMKRAGYRFTNGHQTTLESALAWRAAFPEFRTGFYLQKGWRKQAKLRRGGMGRKAKRKSHCR